MKIIINKIYDKNFTIYLRKIMIMLFNDECIKSRLKAIDEEFNINSYDILLIALKLLKCSELPDCYVLSLNKSIKINDISIDLLINKITYGNRSVKGYPIILNLFNYINNNLDILYEGWENGY